MLHVGNNHAHKAATQYSTVERVIDQHLRYRLSQLLQALY